ncbi:unnamed protein product [Kluyveromyces dobzhanskii CBS 2104]|uniref:WGS project CCBQ000000000 data, contig 00017 n=1 Tax=Kluyveromyces dobzhanskii CBS 2104 TaxID=1427455 RepID=A0A0A8L8P2_9SACH|nr:unnamed protein product [Kluyveromyces dobzhanskii CBS 2104]
MRGRSLFRISNRYFSTRWFYAIDVPKTKPYEASYIPETPPTKFQPFSRVDSRRIEDLYTTNQLSKKIDVNEDHLFQVDLEKLSLSPIFWEGPSYEIRRGIWFNDQNIPLSPDLTDAIEKFHQEWLARDKENSESRDLRDIFRLPKESKWKYILFVEDDKTAYLLPDIYGGNLQLNILRSSVAQLIQIGASKLTKGYEEQYSLTKKAKDIEDHVIEHAMGLGKISDMISWEFKDLIKFPNDDSKGKQEEEMMKDEMAKDYDNNDSNGKSHYRPINHLVLCVHGIGQNLGKKYQYVNFAHTINLLRSNMKYLYKTNSSLQNFNSVKDLPDYKTNSGTQVLPITWRHAIGFNTDETNANRDNEDLPTLADVTVDGIRPLRKLLGDVGLDVLLYGDNFYLDRILKHVSNELNSVYRKYCEHNPDFDGKVSLLGHSLGSLILFDIISQQSKFPLDFEVDNFFSIGSPVGVFKLIQRTKIGESDSSVKQQTPACNNFYNLFHPCDPISYRVEPLIDKSTAKFEAEWIPHASGYDSIADTVKSLISDKNAKEKEMMSQRLLSNLLRFNSNGRVDYSFQPNLLDVDVWSAIKSHVSYFEDMDTAGFILKEILKKHVKPKTQEVTKLKLTEPVKKEHSKH